MRCDIFELLNGLGGHEDSAHCSRGYLHCLVSGCYEVKQDNQGRTVKVNKLTGAASVIEGDRIVKLKNENEIKAEESAVK